MREKNNPAGWFRQERMENSAVFTFSTDVTFQFWAARTDDTRFLFSVRRSQPVFVGETLRMAGGHVQRWAAELDAPAGAPEDMEQLCWRRSQHS